MARLSLPRYNAQRAKWLVGKSKGNFHLQLDFNLHNSTKSTI
jgi:hypothetical protein